MRRIITILLLLAAGATALAADRPNVLFIAVDDLRPESSFDGKVHWPFVRSSILRYRVGELLQVDIEAEVRGYFLNDEFHLAPAFDQDGEVGVSTQQMGEAMDESFRIRVKGAGSREEQIGGL